MFIRPFRNLRQSLLLLLASSLPLQSTFAEAPTASGAPAVRKNKKSDNVGKTIVRSQSPTTAALGDQEAKDAAVFDAGMGSQQPAGSATLPWMGQCNDLPAPPSPPSPNPPAVPNTSSSSNPNNSQYTNAPLSNLEAGQGASTAQNTAPAFFGDFFAPSNGQMLVPGPLLGTGGTTLGAGQTPFGVMFAQPQGSQYSFSYIRQLDLSNAAGGLYTTGQSSNNTIWSNNATPNASSPTNGLIQPKHFPGAPNSYYVPTPFVYSTTSTSTPAFSIPAQTPHNPSAVFATFTTDHTTGVEYVLNGHPVFLTQTHGEGSQPFYGLNPGDSRNPFQGERAYYLVALQAAAPVTIYSPAAVSGGIQKLVDNASPIPRDRVFFNYNFYENTPVQVNGQSLSVNRFTPGFEKTFFNQLMSLEVRVPFATTVNSFNLNDGSTNTSDILLGNQATYLKALFYRNQSFSIAGGIGVQAPTAGSTSYGVNGYTYDLHYAANAAPTQTLASGPQQTIMQVNNQAWHLLPYIGAVYTPNDRLWAQSVGQMNFATNNNSVYEAAQYSSANLTTTNPGGVRTQDLTINSVTSPMTYQGGLRDTNFMYLSFNGGYWMYKIRNPYARGLTGFAPTMEVDYNQSLQRSSSVAGIYGNPGAVIQNQSIVNGVIGANMIFGHNKYVTVGYVAPLTTGTNRVFDGELRVMCNYYFGAPRVNPRFSNVPGT